MKCPQNVIATHAERVFTPRGAGKHGGRFFKSKTSSRIPNFDITIATLGKGATTHERVFFLGQELLL